jgi:hypothetical protein
MTATHSVRGPGLADAREPWSTRHPLRSAQRELRRLRAIAFEGSSAATPLILAGVWLAVLAVLVPLVVAFASLVASLMAG